MHSQAGVSTENEAVHVMHSNSGNVGKNAKHSPEPNLDLPYIRYLNKYDDKTSLKSQALAP